MRSKRFWVVAALPLGALLYLVLYSFASHSDGFEFVSHTVTQSQVVRSRIGDIKKVSLSPFGPYRATYGTDGTRIRMAVVATGTEGRITIHVRIVRLADVWEIREAEVNGKAISLP